MKIDTEEIVRRVLDRGSIYTTSDVRREYGVDVVKYGWVDSYLRDKEVRAEIARLEGEIPKIQSLPIHRDEIKASFMEAMKLINGMWLDQVKSHLLNVQARKTAMMGPESIYALRLVYPLNIGKQEAEALFSGLPEGVKQAEIGSQVEKIEAEIERLRNRIKDEFSPHERWSYSPNGYPWPYPGGCWWTRFVEDWKKIASRFEGNVNLNGCPLESEAETSAFYALGIDKVWKLTPLRKPYIKPPRQKTAQESYNESVTIGSD